MESRPLKKSIFHGGFDRQLKILIFKNPSDKLKVKCFET